MITCLIGNVEIAIGIIGLLLLIIISFITIKNINNSDYGEYIKDTNQNIFLIKNALQLPNVHINLKDSSTMIINEDFGIAYITKVNSLFYTFIIIGIQNKRVPKNTEIHKIILNKYNQILPIHFE